MKSHPNNFCGGNFKDWLEVMLTPKCSGRCVWCIDRQGFHPKTQAPFYRLANRINVSPYKNIILLGGEPTLYRHFGSLCFLISREKNIYVTSNGQNLSILNNPYLYGANLSIHHYNLFKNKEITGIDIDEDKLKYFVKTFHGKTLRFNCNIIKGYIDSKEEILKYISWAKSLGVKNIRFAELKQTGDLISLGKLFDYQYGLNENPFLEGCNNSCVIDGVQVNFRQMCGLNTSCRIKPTNPIVDCDKQVLYYDGKFYNGWQKRRNTMVQPKKKVAKKEIKIKLTKDEIIKGLRRRIKNLEARLEETEAESNGSFCQY